MSLSSFSLVYVCVRRRLKNITIERENSEREREMEIERDVVISQIRMLISVSV